MKTTTTPAEAMETLRARLGMSQAQVEALTGISSFTARRWAQGERPPSRRMLGKYLAAMEPHVRRAAPDLDEMLDPIREAIGREPAIIDDASSVTVLDAVPDCGHAAVRYGIRRPDGSVAVCEARDRVAGHLHAVRWRTASGEDAAGLRRVTWRGKSSAMLTQDDRPGAVEEVREAMIERCDPVVAIIIPLLVVPRGT